LEGKYSPSKEGGDPRLDKTWDNGDLMVHEAVLPYLAREGIPFRVQGQATYEHFRPAIRDSAAAAV